MKKKIKSKFTVFGHTGFLGSNIVRYLKERNYSVYLPARNQTKFPKNLNNVIYCIGSDNVLENSINGVNSNLFILSNIIEKNKFQSFTYISSTRVYLNNIKTHENSHIKIDVNSKHYFFNSLKVAAENLCLSKDNKNVRVVRISNLFGFNFKKQIYLLPTLIRNAIKKKKIEILINKKSKKNYLNVEDAIRITLKIIQKSKYRIYNIASDKRISLEKIAQQIKRNTNCKILYKNQRIKFDEPIININRIKKEYKFKPSSSLEKEISTLLREY